MPEIDDVAFPSFDPDEEPAIGDRYRATQVALESTYLTPGQVYTVYSVNNCHVRFLIDGSPRSYPIPDPWLERVP